MQLNMMPECSRTNSTGEPPIQHVNSALDATHIRYPFPISTANFELPQLAPCSVMAATNGEEIRRTRYAMPRFFIPTGAGNASRQLVGDLMAHQALTHMHTTWP